MEVYLEDDYDFFQQNSEILEHIHKVIEACLNEEKVPYEAEISLTVVDKAEIHEINNSYRQVDRPTDVLSFPQLEAKPDSGIDWDALDTSGCMNFDTNNIMLGDIILCSEVAKEQAIDYGHSLKREVCFLVAHSMFHLLGYDHMTPEEEQIMVSKQEKVLASLHITR